MKRIPTVLAAGAAAAAAAALSASYVVYRIAFHSPDGMQNDDLNVMKGEQMNALREEILPMIRAQASLPYEAVYIRSRDGLLLRGRYYHQRDGAPLDICFHGYRGTPSRDFSGGTALYRDAGHNILMVEQRAHCGSEGHTITFGVKERYDCLDWAEYAVRRFGPDTQIILSGISMGAATVLMASELPLPDSVRGIVADAPYTSPGAIIRKVVREDMHLPADLAWPFLRLGARLWGRFSVSEGNAAEAVRHSRVPILLIHGEDDRFVPCEMGLEIAAAAPQTVELHTFPGAGHGLSYLADRERYTRIVRSFFRRVLLSDESGHGQLPGERKD